MAGNATKLNQSVEKTLAIIELMAAEGKMRLQDIASGTSNPPSTALRMVSTLLKHGYVVQDPDTQLYSLTYKFAVLGAEINSQANLCREALPVLTRLSKACGESCSIAVEENREIVYVTVMDGPTGILKTTQRIGKRAPLYCTGIGKLLLLEYSPARLEEYLSSTERTVFTDKTIVTRDGILQELETVRAQGYAEDNQECELGVHCTAASIYNYAGACIAGISVSCPVQRLTPAHKQEIRAALLRAADELSARMGYIHPN